MEKHDDLDFIPLNRGLGLQPRIKKNVELPKIYKPEILTEKKILPSIKTEDLRTYIHKATSSQRLKAYLLDFTFTLIFYTLFLATIFLLTYFIDGEGIVLSQLSSLKIELSLLFLFTYVFYFSFFDGLAGQTLGKKLCHIEVLWNEAPSKFFRVLIRVLATPLFFFYISEKNYLQDWSSKSTVVEVQCLK
ncbi:MAG: RDD family protein [Deltaproteobacteria bacterium]|nr:RDD family protein [Deltaproteobacteria bacterium]